MGSNLHAETHHYHRATGEKLEGKPGTAQFLASYTKAQQATAQRPKGTFNDLVRAYTGSVEFAELAASTVAAPCSSTLSRQRPAASPSGSVIVRSSTPARA